jgi:hypothetical protein
MPSTRTTRGDLGEIAITTTLLGIYLGARGTDRALGAVKFVLERGLPGSRGR